MYGEGSVNHFNHVKSKGDQHLEAVFIDVSPRKC